MQPGIHAEPSVAVLDDKPVDRVVLTNASGMSVSVLSFGGIIERLMVPDRHGQYADVVMGFERVEDYFTDQCYFGALIGRYANRIAGARFRLDGMTFHLEPNDGTNHLHGGEHGFHTRVWRSETLANGEGVAVRLSMDSPDGDAGYPGAVRVAVTYTLTESNELIVDYHATTDRATPFSMTQHAYFNLAGAGHDILEHHLSIAASSFTPVTPDQIPTGELRDVAGTPFDFTTSQPIGARIDSVDEQLRFGDGYDHNFVLDHVANRLSQPVARLVDPRSGRRLDVLTTEPAMQVCTGNGLHRGVIGKQGIEYGRCSGIALETQQFPDAPNRSEFPSAILRPGEEFQSRTIFRFSTDRS